MVTVLITSFLLLAAIIYAVYRWQETPSSRSAQQDHVLPPQPGWSGLFGDGIVNQQQLASADKAEEREKIFARAAKGERSVLASARDTRDAALYEEVLNMLIGQADSDKKLLALVSYMTSVSPAFSINRRLAERFMETWKASPDRGNTAKMLHIVALADDAALYRQAVETTLTFWREKRIPGLSAEEMCSLAESEYWILSQHERSSGQGFLLKLKLAALRRELRRGTGVTHE
ncbi:MAG TPA: hypothetical protein VGC66_00835 [Pyrinomonadaceae bacterium]|jgi:hypothetical protein